ncbi:MAG: hypothetical protein GY714_20355 [Desulfobacterales bacterium]|nr:hypothetical protein [Desulfobacterales bacterium]
MNNGNYEILSESLAGQAGAKEAKEAVRPQTVARDLRELRAVYYCTATDIRMGIEVEVEECMYFSPGATGKCTFQDVEFCTKEGN